MKEFRIECRQSLIGGNMDRPRWLLQFSVRDNDDVRTVNENFEESVFESCGDYIVDKLFRKTRDMLGLNQKQPT